MTRLTKEQSKNLYSALFELEAGLEDFACELRELVEDGVEVPDKVLRDFHGGQTLISLAVTGLLNEYKLAVEREGEDV